MSKSSRGPWGRRDFRLLWAAGLVNDTGDWLLIVALPVYVLTETGSGVTTALLFVAQLAPAALLGSLAGNLVDRWNLRRTLVATNLAQTIAVLPLLAVSPTRVWPAFLVAVTQSVLTRFNNPANTALLVRVVPEAELASANSARAVSENIARLVGSPLGGIVVAVGGLGGVVIVDGLSFLIVSISTALVRSDAAAVARPATVSIDERRTVPGLRYLRSVRPLPALLATLTISQVAQGMFVVLFLAFVVRRLGGDEADVGIIRGMQAVGGIGAGLLLAGRFARARPPTLFGFGFLGMGLWGFVSWNLPAVTTHIAVYAALMAAAGPFAVTCTVGVTTAIQHYTPRPYLGLYVGTVEASGALGQGLGAITAGVLVDRVNLTWLLNSQAALYVIVAVLGAFSLRPTTPSTETRRLIG